MPNLKFDFSRHICAAVQSVVRAPSLGGAPHSCGLTYLSKQARGDIGAVTDHPASPYHANISLVDGHQPLPKFIEFLFN